MSGEPLVRAHPSGVQGKVSGLGVSREEAKPTTYMSHLTPTIDVAMIIDSRKSV
jgi:hypothetical protein